MRNLIGKSVSNLDLKNDRETQLLDTYNASMIDHDSSEDGEREVVYGFKK